jgi:diguanylate cyclase (GGDEF)-like protein/PAS domain S-box-containing protein/putative nucleotidyltransferase with HDIG domain
MEMILGILINIILLFGLTLLVSISDKTTEMNKGLIRVVYGFMIGFFAIFIMMNAWSFEEGVFYDTRSILISNTALFFHPVTSIIALLFAVSYRIYIGGIGVYAGVLTLFFSMGIGLLFKFYVFGKTKFSKYLELYVFGFVVHIFMILSQLAFPYPRNVEIIKDISLFVLISYPIASLLLGIALLNNNQRIRNTKKLHENIDQLNIQKERYEQLSNYSETIVWELDTTGLYTYVDDMIEPILKIKPDDVINKMYFYEFIAPEHKSEIIRAALKTMENQETFNNLIYKNIAKDGSVVWLSTSGFPVYDNNGQYTGYRGSDKNITEQIEQASLLEETEKRYQVIFEQNPLGMIQYNEKGHITLANDAFSEMLGSTSEKLKGLKMLHLPDKKLVAALKRSLEGQTGIYQDYYHAVTSDKVVAVRVQFCPIKNKDHLVIGGIGIVEDLTNYLKNREEIRKLSTTDTLTGLLNRRMFDEHLEQFRDTDQFPFAVIMCDINTLRVINESFGYDKGDFVILELTRAINEAKDDAHLVFRIGGDEFAILMPNANASTVEGFIEQVKTSLDLSTEEFPISVSFGYALKENKSTELTEVLKNAEGMMHSNKIYDGASISKKTIDIIMQTLFEKSSREMYHSQRVSALSEEIAMHYKLGTSFKNRVKIAALLHDIGKINVDGYILNKATKLSEEEWLTIKKHPEYGFRILNSVDEYMDVAGIVLNHHERWDGLGYPRKIRANNIPLEARIIAVADAYDAMTKDRLYRDALSKDDAIIELKNNAGTQFDPKVVEIFVQKVLHYAVKE